MAFLELNGITVPVTNASVRRRLERRGARSRSYRGALRDSRRGIRRQWELEICFPEYEEGEAFVRLIEGHGHFFDFSEGVIASTSLGPVGDLRALELRPNQWGAKGRGHALVDELRSGADDPSGFFEVAAQLRDDWTVLWSERQPTGEGPYESLGWSFLAKRSDGVGYKNGARNDNVGGTFGGTSESLSRVLVRDGDVILQNRSGLPYGFDDLLLLPYSVPESWLATWTEDSPLAPKLPALPVLTARGDITEEAFAYVVGEVTGVDYIQKPTNLPNLGWVNNAMRIRARLSEVDPAFYCVEERFEETVRLPGTAQPLHWFTANDVDGLANGTLSDDDPVSSWVDFGSAGLAANSIGDAYLPIFKTRGDFPAYRAPTVRWKTLSNVPGRLRTAIPAVTSQPNTALCIYRTTDPVGTVTQYVTDGATTSHRLIFRAGPYADQEFYAGTFLPTGTGVNVATVRQWNVGIGLADGLNSVYRWNGSDAIGNAGTLGVQGLTIGGLTNTTGSNFFDGDLVELVVWGDAAGTNGVPTFAEIEQYVIDRYLEGG